MKRPHGQLGARLTERLGTVCPSPCRILFEIPFRGVSRKPIRNHNRWSVCKLRQNHVFFALRLNSIAGREYGGKAMAAFGRSITTTALFLGIAAVITGCSQTGTRQSMIRKQSTHNAYSASSPRSSVATSYTTIVPKKYGLVERHDIMVDPGHQQNIYLQTVHTLASIDTIENSDSVKGVIRMTDYTLSGCPYHWWVCRYHNRTYHRKSISKRGKRSTLI